ncbi:hypothetical protein [Haloarcula argentinensis]|uniref:DUF4352 domain-containing protein n=1 Tax=Haloarcula argentinensis TaxID=43776 RepID=A0ABU2F186_HALAR|nr:hypothetical protein [Haloarcula argentinensis]EMA19256.1 hypothetical protein C443_16606 [Haloarcula argentinensis DSM 12282]MDS0254251.1 hypothetical protein [Haloarcula argentinensis]
MQRRKFIRAVSAGSAVVIAGCAGESEPDVVLEYNIKADQAPEEIPEDIRKSRKEGGRLEEGSKWVVVTLDVAEGTLDMQDVWFRSRIETDERFYDLAHASDGLSSGIQSRGEIKQGGSGVALYQIPTGTGSYSWNLEEMRQDVEANEN